MPSTGIVRRMKLATYMQRHKLDDAAFAKMVGGGCSTEAVRKWRYGQRVPRPSVIQRVDDITRGAVTLSDFIEAYKPYGPRSDV